MIKYHIYIDVLIIINISGEVALVTILKFALISKMRTCTSQNRIFRLLAQVRINFLTTSTSQNRVAKCCSFLTWGLIKFFHYA